ncbi:TauD/TfdA dioxygenase family protein [Pseudomonas chlororaphis]|uniref:TauD/TfdA dioxygenase family protein n=1 Tax=Pseudomonas chlororaphis TaxID=587753 RepID=UPI00046F16D7|nr:TauD/TfdA family dioxygenase [Pseudomonas chlororaphis]
MNHLEPLSPFGLVIHAAEPKAVPTSIAPDVLTDLLKEHRVLVLRGFSALEDGPYADFCQTFGELMLWEFGAVLNVRLEQNPKNHLFSKGRVELHWDGAFAQQIPKINVFQCVASSSSGDGGETLFVDTTRLLADASAHERQLWDAIELSYSTEKKAHYGGDIHVRFIDDHPHFPWKVLRFIETENEDNLEVNPVKAVIKGFSDDHVRQEAFVRDLTRRMYADSYMYKHRWKQGDYMLIDNNSVLHGRAKVHGNVSRHLKRVHVL